MCPHTPRPADEGDETRVAGRTGLQPGYARLSTRPTGHPLVSWTGHPGCRATDKPIARLERKNVLQFLDAKAGTPAAANALLKMLRILVRFGIDRGMLDTDPTLGVRNVRYAPKGFRQWTEQDIATFEAHWLTGSRARLAMALLLYTGQRPGDVSRMGRQHVQGGVLTLTQRKTGTRLAIPLHDALKTEIDHAPAGQLTFLLTQEGKGFSDAGFSQWFSERARVAGVGTGCTAHGLRKAAAGGWPRPAAHPIRLLRSPGIERSGKSNATRGP